MVARITPALLRTPKGGTAHMARLLCAFASLVHNVGKTGFDSTLFYHGLFQGIPSDDRFTTTNRPPQMNHPNFNISEILSKASIGQARMLVFVPLARLGCCD